MSEFRSLDLRTKALQGRFGASNGETGVSLSLVHPVSLVQVLVRKGGTKAVEAGLAGLKSARVDARRARTIFCSGRRLGRGNAGR